MNMKKLINDTLKEKGKYSRKSLTVLVTFLFILALGTFIVISDKILEKEVNRYAIDVFNSLLVFLTLLMGLTEAGKKLLNKNESVNEEES
jgi:di/tricarboxylate transporter